MSDKNTKNSKKQDSAAKSVNSSVSGSGAPDIVADEAGASTSAMDVDSIEYMDVTDEGPRLIIANRIFIGGLTDSISREELKAIFSQFGTVTAVKVILDETGSTKGFGFLDFRLKEEAQRALKGSENLRIGQRKLKIEQAYRKPKFNHITNTIPHIIPNPFPVVYLPHTIVQNNYLATAAMAPTAAPMPTVSAVNESMYYPEYLPTVAMEEPNANPPYYNFAQPTITPQGPFPYYPYFTPGPSYYVPPGNYNNNPNNRPMLYPIGPYVNQANYVPVNESMMYPAANLGNEALTNPNNMYSAEAYNNYNQNNNEVVNTDTATYSAESCNENNNVNNDTKSYSNNNQDNNEDANNKNAESYSIYNPTDIKDVKNAAETDTVENSSSYDRDSIEGEDNDDEMYCTESYCNKKQKNNEDVNNDAAAPPITYDGDYIIEDENNRTETYSAATPSSNNENDIVEENNDPLIRPAIPYQDRSKIPTADQLWASCFASLKKVEKQIAAAKRKNAMSSTSRSSTPSEKPHAASHSIQSDGVTSKNKNTVSSASLPSKQSKKKTSEKSGASPAVPRSDKKKESDN